MSPSIGSYRRGGSTALLLVLAALTIGACADRRQIAATAAPSPATQCDQLAANPRDATKTAPGVASKSIDAPRAIAACEAAVKREPASARLAYQLARGYDSSKDFARAAELYGRAADRGHVLAQTSLANMYETGEGVTQDLAEAARRYQLAAQGGDAWAWSSLGYMHQQGEHFPVDNAEALRLYRQGAAGGDHWAEVQIGLMYENGWGVPADAVEAVKWYRQAAAAGESMGQYDLGVMYDTGKGVPQDYAEALNWYRLAADQGELLAKFNIGRMHRYGHGMAQDLREAERLWREGADQGDFNAQNSLAYLYAEQGRNLADALALAGQALAQQPNSGDALDTRGWILHMLGRDAEALADLELAATLESEQPALVRDHLGDVQARLGQIDAAEESWRAALSLQPDATLEQGLRQKLGLAPGAPAKAA